MPAPISKVLRCLYALLTLTLPVSAPAQTNAPVISPAPPTPPAEIVALHNIVFGKGGTQDLHAEIAYPKDAAQPLPAIIYIHGGGWRSGTDKDFPIRQIAEAGYFGASIEYRLSGVAKWPAQIEDCKCAVRWLRANAAQYHVDPKRIGVMGSSAGGHLVACLGTMADVKNLEGTGGYPGVSSAVQAVVDYYGPVDFIDPLMDTPQAIKMAPPVEALFGVPREKNPDLWKSGSPIFYVKAGDPPFLILHGDRDLTVPLEQSTLFDAALTKAGVPHQFIVVKRVGHGFIRLKPGDTTTDPTSDEIQQIIYAFFGKYLKTP